MLYIKYNNNNVIIKFQNIPTDRFINPKFPKLKIKYW